jgi:Nucleotidyltransferase domain
VRLGPVHAQQGEQASVARPEIEDATSLTGHVRDQYALPLGAVRIAVRSSQVAEGVLSRRPFLACHALIIVRAVSPPKLPVPVATLAGELAHMPGTVGVVLGGSRATGTNRPESDWDLGLYYRRSQRPLAPEDVRRLGHHGYVSELGEWGPIVNGGAWLTIDGTAVDILFRDLDTVETWHGEARQGRFEVLVQNGYIVGAPTYLPIGELAICRPITGELPRPSFPKPLAAAAFERWQGRARVSLMFAQGYAEAGDAICCAGMLTDAILCLAHARLAQRHEWALNEKRLVRRAGLDELQGLLPERNATGAELAVSVATIGSILGIEPLSAR